MDLQSNIHGDVLVIEVDASRIDAVAAIQFKDLMRKAYDGWNGRVVVDMTKVEFVDSSGLGALVACFKHIGKSGTMELSGLSPTVTKLFDLTRMDQVMVIHPSIESVLDAA